LLHCLHDQFLLRCGHSWTQYEGKIVLFQPLSSAHGELMRISAGYPKWYLPLLRGKVVPELLGKIIRGAICNGLYSENHQGYFLSRYLRLAQIH